MKRFITMFLAVLTLLTVVPTKTLAEEASLYALGSCRTCGGMYSYTLEYEVWDETYHGVRHWCSSCGLDQYEGTNAEHHTMSNGSCTKCGYSDGSGSGGGEGGGGGEEPCTHRYTSKNWSGCDWEERCDDCGELIDSGTSHGSTNTRWDGCDWEEYCENCGEVFNYGTNHGPCTYTDWEYLRWFLNKILTFLSLCVII